MFGKWSWGCGSHAGSLTEPWITQGSPSTAPQTAQQSHPASPQLAPGLLEQGRNGKVFPAHFSSIISNSSNTTENSFSFSSKPRFPHTSHPGGSFSRAAAGFNFRLGFSQCVPVCLHFQAACWALPRTLLTLLLLTLNAWCDSQSSGDL